MKVPHMYKKIITAATALGLLSIPALAQERPTVQQVQQELANQEQQQPAPPPVNVPPQLTIKAGTYLTVRLNEVLSSDRSQTGDAFTATLTKPLVVDGIVVAQRGQSVTGRVTEVKKAGRIAGTSRLGVQLVELTAVDGQQLPLQSELLTRNGTTSTGRDAAAMAGTTGLGAAIGAGVNGGVGAGVGAGAGLVVGLAGVLLTRGHATMIYPETMLTFRVDKDITISTEHSAQAFRYVTPADYQQSAPAMARRPMPPRPGYGYGYAYGSPYYGYPYWGPSFYFGGPRFYGRRW